MRKDDVRARARELGLRTAAKPDSQDVCFIHGGEGRHGFLRRRLALHPAVMVDRRSGQEVGSLDAVELVTVGQRRGMGHAADGSRRYVTAVDVAAQRVTVSSLGDAMVRHVRLDPASLTWTAAAAGPGSPVIAQLSAHGKPVRCTLQRSPDPVLQLASAQRPVAPGQTVALYDVSDPELVVGAAIAA
jgi:tRNA-specific 2-thiouridylase